MSDLAVILNFYKRNLSTFFHILCCFWLPFFSSVLISLSLIPWCYFCFIEISLVSFVKNEISLVPVQKQIGSFPILGLPYDRRTLKLSSQSKQKAEEILKQLYATVFRVFLTIIQCCHPSVQKSWVRPQSPWDLKKKKLADFSCFWAFRTHMGHGFKLFSTPMKSINLLVYESWGSHEIGGLRRAGGAF